jgi:hypothetical protein
MITGEVAAVYQARDTAVRTQCAPFLLQLTWFFPAPHIQPPCELDRQDSGFYLFLKVALCDPARFEAALPFEFPEADEAAAQICLSAITECVALIGFSSWSVEKAEFIESSPRLL